jgi:hypothetical protein
MRTFDLTIATTARVVVPETFVQAMRTLAKGDPEEAGPFLVEMQKQHPEDDDEFILAVLKNGTRLRVRDALANLYGPDGLGYTLAPASVQGEPRLPPPEDAQPLLLTDALADEHPVNPEPVDPEVTSV